MDIKEKRAKEMDETTQLHIEVTNLRRKMEID